MLYFFPIQCSLHSKCVFTNQKIIGYREKSIIVWASNNKSHSFFCTLTFYTRFPTFLHLAYFEYNRDGHHIYCYVTFRPWTIFFLRALQQNVIFIYMKIQGVPLHIYFGLNPPPPNVGKGGGFVVKCFI